MAPPHPPGGRTLAWHCAHLKYEGEGSVQAAGQTGRPAAAGASTGLPGRPPRSPLSPISGPPLELTNEPGTYFFLAIHTHTTHTQPARKPPLFQGSLSSAFWGQWEPTATGLGSGLSHRSRDKRFPWALLWAGHLLSPRSSPWPWCLNIAQLAGFEVTCTPHCLGWPRGGQRTTSVRLGAQRPFREPLLDWAPCSPAVKHVCPCLPGLTGP